MIEELDPTRRNHGECARSDFRLRRHVGARPGGVRPSLGASVLGSCYDENGNPVASVSMKHIPSWLLMVETTVLVLVGAGLLSTVASDSASLLPTPVRWMLVVLVALVLAASVVELIRRKIRRC